ncbi:MarR family winged helix-turn-helix transcriptional regulator [Anaerocolumna sp. MB42-C2]|uniref:MarR family winged helix-turn-helix transcriptional regulator n=1 Tax=Anaerocolumna sp. MB42-C2 TaxID=3070997 RepID=UPI0027DF6DCB|nr:MarR family transcriptional regulator [Anaerocolumna sp. MB42-C2]WMJ87236.1 MarR family transcriptional regulator [Anaerocolumna sp. MB42-C2]
MNEQIYSFIPLLKMINDGIEKKINNELKEFDLTFSQIRVVALLYHSVQENYSMKELEKIFHVSQQTIAGIVKRLEAKDMIVSISDADDKRIKRIKLTENGKKLGAEAQLIKVEKIEEWVLKPLNAEEQDMILSLLKKIYNYIE